MKKILGGIVGVGLLAVVGLGGFVAMQPGELAIERSIEVAGSPADVQPFAVDMQKFNEWSPWKDVDPNVKWVYSDNPAGKGAWYTWEGNDEVGKGKMSIDAVAPGKVDYTVAFEAPMQGTAHTTVAWEGDAEKTTITWSFKQPADFMTKAANLVLDIESMLEGDYDKGLSQLKPLVEGAAKQRIVAEKKAAAEQAAKEAAAAAELAAEAAEKATQAAAEAAEAAR